MSIWSMCAIDPVSICTLNAVCSASNRHQIVNVLGTLELLQHSSQEPDPPFALPVGGE